MSRAGRAGLLRNAAIAIGNSQDSTSENVLITALKDTEPLIRGAVAWALGQLATQTAHAALESQLMLELDEIVIQEITAALHLRH